MTDNVLAKLREKRARATVPVREDALVPKQEIKPNIPHSNKELVQIEESSSQSEFDNTKSIEHLEQEIAEYPETVRHSGIVLEKGIDQRLTSFCRENKITVELFLEAAWHLSESEPDLLGKIIVEAKKRYVIRKKVGSARRLLTTLKKLKS